jgi:hypothetical protein
MDERVGSAHTSAGPHEGPTVGQPPTRAGALRRIGGCLGRGVPKGLKSAAWLLAIMVPVSFGVMMLDWTGLLGLIAYAFEPVFRLVGLPGEIAVAFITGMFLNIYSSIAAMATIPLTERQVTIIALIVLISHNLPVEVSVQKKTGTAAWKMIALRLGMSVVGAVALSLLMPADPGEAAARATAQERPERFLSFLREWASSTAFLLGKVAGLVMALMVLHQLLIEFGVARLLARVFYPVLWLLGLPRSTTVLWMVANTLGLAYGAAVIVEESESGRLTAEDAQYLNRHVGVCHSLLEDTLLYVAIGAWVLWITIPRVLLAAVAVWGYRAWRAVVPQNSRPGQATGLTDNAT